jgi:hypothetical protein
MATHRCHASTQKTATLKRSPYINTEDDDSEKVALINTEDGDLEVVAPNYDTI